MTDRGTRIEALFHAARSVPPEKREAWLAAQCGGDDALAREVRSLVEHADQASSFLEYSAAGLVLRPIEPGTVVGGCYEVGERIGVGGMGEVYRARDRKLGRDVALKVLPVAFAEDGERIARFRREAKVLATLNHSNIAQIYGQEEHGDTPALVMELVEGPTLGDRIAQGPIPIDDALAIARQIAEALDAAHERGIVHRDLKPANVKVREDGTVKVLDFGLAKAIDPVGIAGSASASASPTATTPASTQLGMILGTASYMSPEQARGQPVDKRTDVWAFGCVLYEMLSGQRAFSGETVSDILAHVLTAEPDWGSLPADTPAPVRRLIQRCVQKNVARRLRDVGDALFDLTPDESSREHQTVPAARRLGWRTTTAALLVLLSGGVLGLMAWRSDGRADPADSPPVARFTLSAPAGEVAAVRGTRFAISPDGHYVAFETVHDTGSWLYLRDLSTGDARRISQASAGRPFFSPDSVWLAFFEQGMLKKVAVRGGQPIPLADASLPRGGSWGTDEMIVFAPDARGPLVRVPASGSGGHPQPLTTLDADRGDTSHSNPEALPGDRGIIYRAEGTTAANGVLVAFSPATGQDHVLLAEGGTDPHYSPTGHLLYRQGGNLMAVPFDPVRLEMTGRPVAVLEDVQAFALSNLGTLICATGRSSEVTLTWVDRQGLAEPLPLPARRMRFPRLTLDNRQVAVTVLALGQRDIWIGDTGRGTFSRVTRDGASDWPVWTPDARELVHASNRPGTVWDIVGTPADGRGATTSLVVQPQSQTPRDISPDGSWLAYQDNGVDNSPDIWLLPLAPGGPARPFARSEAIERWPAFSPDGRWVAYTSNESDQDEVYVRSVTGDSGKWQVSSSGGVEPRWNPAGGELFYRHGGEMLAVAVTVGDTFSAGAPEVLFDDASYPLGMTGTNYDVARDGNRFLMLKETAQDPRLPLTVVTNWFEELKRLVPTE